MPRSTRADVTELVDVPDLGSGVARRGGSSPLIRTICCSLVGSGGRRLGLRRGIHLFVHNRKWWGVNRLVYRRRK